MSEFKNKIDFAVLFTVEKANPNGDTLNGNCPRTDNDGYGEMSDVCIKRKIRNRLQDMGEKIFVQSQERADDGKHSLSERADANPELLKHKKIKIRMHMLKPRVSLGLMLEVLDRYLHLKIRKGMKTVFQLGYEDR